MSVGQDFWIVATGCAAAEKDGIYSNLSGSLPLADSKVKPMKLSIPEGLPFGSFDSLVRLTDDLAKADQQLDSIVHRLERQYVEIDPDAKFMIKTQRQEKTLKEYLATFDWDEAKCPKSRTVADNLAQLTSVVFKLDEEVRAKTGQFNETKTQKNNVAKKDGAILPTRDLVDLLTPDVVTMKGNANDDFIESEHMTTVCVIVPRGGDKEFLKLYPSFSEDVVPDSAKKFTGQDDKDGNMLYRVVLFKTGVETFKKACREKRFVPRDFTYSADDYKTLLQTRKDLAATEADLFGKLRELCQAAWSDVMVSWFHVKAMRVYVECVLRYGIGTPIASFVVVPKSVPAARKELAAVLNTTAAKGPMSAEKLTEAAAEEGEEYFPYVSFSFTPFTAQR